MTSGPLVPLNVVFGGHPLQATVAANALLWHDGGEGCHSWFVLLFSTLDGMKNRASLPRCDDLLLL